MKQALQSVQPTLSPRDEQLLQRLIALNLVSEDQRHILLTEMSLSYQPVEKLLVDLSFVSEGVLGSVLAELDGSPIVSLRNYAVDLEVLRKVPLATAEACMAVPIGYQKDPEGVVIAMADVNDLRAYDQIRQFFPDHYVITTVMASCSEILETIHTHQERSVPFTQQETCSLNENSAVHFVQHILREAVRMKASDIHLEPETVFVRVRYRSDGILKVAFSFHQNLWSAVCVHLKVLAGMDIAETRRPQDGRFTMGILGRPIDFRVASHPNIYGENLVIRVLDKTRSLATLEKLGYTEGQLGQLTDCLKQPEGIFIVTGPTGAGKTTTLYAVLGLFEPKELNIMTLEEPVEYCLPHIRQTEIRDGGPLSFADGMRSILRQDPDIILVGEMRDRETAHIAARAAMTGHLVLSTLHTNNALGVIYRFMDFEIPLSLLAGHLNGVLAQRLVRVLCEHCREEGIISDQERQLFKLPSRSVCFRPKGCEHCQFKGYVGRQAVAEILVIDEAMKELILKKASFQEMGALLKKRSFQTLQKRGIELMGEGKTSLEEVKRVVGF